MCTFLTQPSLQTVIIESFILFSFYFFTICARLPIILVPPGEILIPFPQTQSRVLSAGGYISATNNSANYDHAYNTPGQGRLLC